MKLNIEECLNQERKNLENFRRDIQVTERLITTTIININNLKRWQYDEEMKNGKINIQDENEIL